MGKRRQSFNDIKYFQKNGEKIERYYQHTFVAKKFNWH